VVTLFAAPITGVASGELAGSLWRLVNIASMDDSVVVADAEIDAFVHKMKRGMRGAGLDAADDLTPEETVEAEDFHRRSGGVRLAPCRAECAWCRQRPDATPDWYDRQGSSTSQSA
jgi:hypothetical protein